MNVLEKKKILQKLNCLVKHGINVGHLTHIEKGTRHPSHKALKKIAKSLDVPFEPLFHTYDKSLNKDQALSDYMNYICYDKIPAISKIDTYINCPKEFSEASFAYKMKGNSMYPLIEEDSYVFVEINGLIKNKEIGLFRLNNDILIRKLVYRKNSFVLKAVDKNYKDIVVSDDDDFQIIGKIYM